MTDIASQRLMGASAGMQTGSRSPVVSACMALPGKGRSGFMPAAGLALLLLVGGCANDEPVPVRSTMSPAEARALIARSMPAGVADRPGWAADIYAALSAIPVAVTIPNFCAAIAVVEQESSFRANPTVPGLSGIAWREIDAKAERAGVPNLVARAALRLPSSDGRSFADRIDAATTEKELSDIFEDIIGMVPLGRRFLAGANPVRTGGPMQVSIAYAQSHAAAKPYPYPGADNIRREIFTRRGGLYFGIAHLLDYPAGYERMIHRFADFNAGHYASRNAAFQNALAIASGIALDLDGDLVLPGTTQRDKVGATEAALRSLAPRLGIGPDAIRSALDLEKAPGFSRTSVYQRVFEAADRAQGKPVPRALVPKIQLKSPKITRDLTTEWFAQRVDDRHQRCMARAAASSS